MRQNTCKPTNIMITREEFHTPVGKHSNPSLPLTTVNSMDISLQASCFKKHTTQTFPYDTKTSRETDFNLDYITK